MKKKIFGLAAVALMLGAVFTIKTTQEVKAETTDRIVKKGHYTWDGQGCRWPGNYCVRKVVFTYN